MLTAKGTAKAAWEAIKLQNQGSNRAATHVRRLRTEFKTITFIEILLDSAKITRSLEFGSKNIFKLYFARLLHPSFSTTR
jgi:hypothetical protein